MCIYEYNYIDKGVLIILEDLASFMVINIFMYRIAGIFGEH